MAANHGTFEGDRGDLDEFIEEEATRDAHFRLAYEAARVRSALLEALVRARKRQNLTQTQVASRMETTQSNVSELESGELDCRLSTLQRYARAVGVRLEVRLAVEAPARTSQALGTDALVEMPVAPVTFDPLPARRVSRRAQKPIARVSPRGELSREAA